MRLEAHSFVSGGTCVLIRKTEIVAELNIEHDISLVACSLIFHNEFTEMTASSPRGRTRPHEAARGRTS